MTDSNVADYLSTSRVRAAFQALVPYATWDMSVKTHRLSDNTDLKTLLSNNTMFSREIDGKYGSQKYHANYYNDRAAYSYLQSHASQYYSDSKGAITLPVYEFVFNGSSTFAYTTDEAIARSLRVPGNPAETFSGRTEGDLVIISMNSAEIFDYGFGLTQTTIHELGHMMGLMHDPFHYGYTENYVSSPMSYWTYEYNFSQFDIDAIAAPAHADYFFSNIQNAMASAASVTLQSKDAQSILTRANTTYQLAMTDYSSKNYTGAVINLQGLSKLLDQAFDAETAAIQDRVQNASSVTSDVAKKFLTEASNQIVASKQQRTAGNLGLAYEFLTEAGISTSNTLQVEAQSLADAQAKQNAYYTALLLGIAVGVVLGFGIGIVFLRKRNTGRGHKAGEDQVGK